MDICIVNDNFSIGGVQRVATELANNLSNMGYKVTLIDFSGQNIFFYPVSKKINIPNAIGKRTFKRRVIGKLLKVTSSIFKKPLPIKRVYLEQIDDLTTYLKNNNHKVLITCQGLLTSIIPYIKKEIPDVKVLAWQHSEYDIYVNKYYKKFINYYFQGLKSADYVICLTEADQKKFEKINRNVSYIYNPVTIKNIDNRKSDLSKKQVIFVGRLDIVPKGLDILIKIAKNIKSDWRIVVAGDGRDKKKFLQMIKKEHLENKIILKGALKNEDLIETYLDGSIFISTSRWEGFGLVITEAMLFGLPIISFSNSGPKEILKNGEYGILVNNINVNEFTSKLNDLIENPLKREYFQMKSLERVKDFDSSVIIKEWELIIKRFI